MANEAPDYFQPEGGLVLTHLLIVRDVDRSREFYQRVLGATVVRDLRVTGPRGEWSSATRACRRRVEARRGPTGCS
jgi:hypothetical protein